MTEYRLVPLSDEQVKRLENHDDSPFLVAAYGNGLTGAEAHELFSAVMAHVSPEEVPFAHPLAIGMQKLAAIQGEDGYST